MTWDEYVDKLDAHANQCEVCATSRKLNTIDHVCEQGQAIVDEYAAGVTNVKKS